MGRLEFNDSDRLKIGIKQSVRAINENQASVIYIAKDVEDKLLEELVKLTDAKAIPVIYVESKKALGKACHIDVGAATVVVLK